MSTYVIDLAKTHALLEFASLMRRVMRDAERSLAQSLTNAAGDQRAVLVAARQILSDDAAIVEKRLNTVFAADLERAMKTMYTDLRPRLDSVSIDSLSLIDDETVNRQIEVDRVVVRLREADPQSLGRLNIIVAQLHEEHKVRERENPFRPYLLARALHLVARESSPRPPVSAVLFERMANAAVDHLPGYYTAIRAIFESSGVEASLQAVPWRLDLTQRGVGRDTGGARLFDRMHSTVERASAKTREAGSLQQLLTAIKNRNGDTAPVSRLHAVLTSLPRSLPKNPGSTPQSITADESALADADLPSIGDLSAAITAASGAIMVRLNALLRQASVAQESDDARNGSGALLQSCPAQCRLSAAREQLPGRDGGEFETLIIDLVAALFDRIGGDLRLASAVRARIAQLQLPFLKATLTTPDLLLDAGHPARTLLNRLGSVAFGLDTDTAPGRRIAAESARIAAALLQDAGNTEDVTGAFATRLEELERFLSAMMAGDAARTINAIGDALREQRRLAYITSSLRALMAPMPFDAGITLFIIKAWTQMFGGVGKSESTAEGGAARRGEYASLLAGLVWSLHDKATPEEKSTLLRILPGLVKRIHSGLEAIDFPADERRAAIDLLVAAHKKVLVGTAPDNVALPGLDALQRRFAVLADVPNETAMTTALPQSLDAAAVAQALSAHGTTLAVHLQGAKITAASDSMNRLLHGVAIEYDAGETAARGGKNPAAEPLRLIWTDAGRSMLLFARLGPAESVSGALFSAAAAHRALQNGTLRIAEPAPLFEFALDTVLHT